MAARIRQDTATCNFSSIEDPQDEAMRTRFICSVGNEAVLKMLFKENNDRLKFTRAVQLACETEDAAQVAKETIYGPKQQSSKPVHAVTKKHNKARVTPNPARQSEQNFSGTCMRCGNVNHKAKESRVNVQLLPKEETP